MGKDSFYLLKLSTGKISRLIDRPTAAASRELLSYLNRRLPLLLLLLGRAPVSAAQRRCHEPARSTTI
uniref:Uncharacterized protein n=1 Tax=Trichogramma kaykai TaxID=54128 RepID=A0ABD2VUV3_9HYME